MINYLDSDEGFKDDIKSEPTEKEENVKKYCLCRKPEQHPMIGCDFCEEWYHNSCLNLTKEDIKRLRKICDWECPKCEHIKSKVNGFIQIERINVESLKCKYAICEKIFADKKSLNNHVQTFHKGVKQCQSVSSKNKEKLHLNLNLTENIANEYVHIHFLRNTADIYSNDEELGNLTGNSGSNTTKNAIESANTMSNDADIDSLVTDTVLNTADIANKDVKLATIIGNVTSNTENTTNIASYDAEIASLVTDIATNTVDIDNKDIELTSESSKIVSNKDGEMATLVTDTATNAANIASNNLVGTIIKSIESNTADVTSKDANIATRVTENYIKKSTENSPEKSTKNSSICYNSASIASNNAGIGSNTANITSNVTDIIINTVGKANNDAGFANMINVVGTNAGDILINSKDILTNPTGIFHEKKKAFNCKHCRSSFEEKRELRKHMAVINAQRIETRKIQGLWKTNTSGINSNNIEVPIPKSDVGTYVDDKECNIKMTIKITTKEIKLRNNLRNILKIKGKFGKVKLSDTREKFDKKIENTMARFKSRRFIYPVTDQK